MLSIWRISWTGDCAGGILDLDSEIGRGFGKEKFTFTSRLSDFGGNVDDVWDSTLTLDIEVTGSRSKIDLFPVSSLEITVVFWTNKDCVEVDRVVLFTSDWVAIVVDLFRRVTGRISLCRISLLFLAAILCRRLALWLILFWSGFLLWPSPWPRCERWSSTWVLSETGEEAFWSAALASSSWRA